MFVKTKKTMEGKGASEKIMFTLRAYRCQLFSSQEKGSHQSPPAPCIRSTRREFKTQPWLLFPGWSESLVEAQDALRRGGPSDRSLFVPRQRLDPQS